MEEYRLIKGRWGDESQGATRKYYEITDEGRKAYAANKAKWQTVKQLIDILIG